MLRSVSVLLLLLVLSRCEELKRYQVPSPSSSDQLQEDSIYSNFVIDEENSKLIVASTNAIMRLDFDFALENRVIVPPEAEAVETCEYNFRSEQECQNYHRVLVMPEGAWQVTGTDDRVWNASDTILTCSSNAFLPRCHYRDRTSLSLLTDYSSGAHFSPFGPFKWIPALWSSTGRLIVATPQDDRLNMFGLTMSDAPFSGRVEATTLPDQRLWFNKGTPKFVSMYEIGDYIYVFFREEAVEANERVVYSRVARICKNDTGAFHDGNQIFTTFVKARMSCSITDGLPYFYNDIYDTFYLPEERRLYAVFQSPQNGPLGSVVCAFTFGSRSDDLAGVFGGKYLEEVGQSQFEIRDNFNPFTCAAGNRELQEALRIQLMLPTAMQQGEGPVLRMQGYAFQRIVADHVNERDVFFITATREGEDTLLLLKVMSVPEDEREADAPTHRVIETTVLNSDPSRSHMVTKMQLQGVGSSAHLFIGTESDIYRVPVQNCSQYRSCCQCVTVRDPYCAFDTESKTCRGSVPVSSFLQDLVGGDSDLCAANTDPTRMDTTEPVKTCSGGGGVVTESTTGTGTGTGPTLSPIGLGTTRPQGAAGPRSQAWIIVGTVLGFIGGVVAGVIVVIIFKRVGFCGSRRNKNFDLTRSCEITNETKNPRPHTTVHFEKNKNGGGAPSSATATAGGCGQKKKEEVFNNSTTTATTSKRPSNDYHLTKMPTSPVKVPPSPVKQPLNSPNGAGAPVTGPPSEGNPKKCVDTPTPPSLSPPPSAASSGYRSQSSIFTFHPSSVHTTSLDSTPKSTGSYSRSISGASAYSDTPLQVSTEKPENTDPNMQLNYKARVYLTSEEKRAYGRNILARMPSIDGSKAKYLVGAAETGGGRVHSSASLYNGGSLQRGLGVPGYPRRQEIVQLDSELGCSQC